MDEKTKDIILSAWRENRLAAVHVDLIDFCLEKKTTAAFEGVRANAAQMRVLNIPNIWVTFDSSGQDLDRSAMTVAEMDNDPENRISSVVEAHGGETVVIKNELAAFKRDEDTALSLELDRLQADTILIDGVYSSGCISATITEGILRKRYNFVAITDGMNWPDLSGAPLDCLSELRKYCEEYSAKMGPDLNRNLSTATRRDLEKLLVNNPSGPASSMEARGLGPS